MNWFTDKYNEASKLVFGPEGAAGQVAQAAAQAAPESGDAAGEPALEASSPAGRWSTAQDVEEDAQVL